MAHGGSDSDFKMDQNTLTGAESESKQTDVLLTDTTETYDTRQRTMTEKGRVYRIERLTNKLDVQFSQLKRKYRCIEQLINENSDITEIRTEHHSWLMMYDEYLQLYSEFTDIHGDEMNQFEDKNCLLEMFKSSIEKWFLQDSKKKETFITAGDSVSQVRRPSSRVSQTSSVTSARMKEDQKRAELTAKLSAISLKKDIELAKLDLKVREEQLALQTEIEVVNARTRVLDQLEQGSHVRSNKEYMKADFDNGKIDYGVSSGRLDTGNVNVKREQEANLYNRSLVNIQPLRPTARPFVPDNHYEYTVPNVNYTPQETNQLFSAAQSPVDLTLSNVVKQLRMPVPDIKCFDGNPLDYKRFVRQFQSKIVCNTDKNDELFIYLEQFTTGEANKVVSACSFLDATHGYTLALRELERRYGSQEVLANAFVKRALDWPFIKADSPQSLDQFSIFLEECHNAIKAIDAVRVLQYPDNLKKLVTKLPFQYQEKWRGIVMNVKLRNESVEFHHLTDFVKLEAAKACDPTYGRDAMRLDQKQNTGKFQAGKNTAQNKQYNKGSFATNAADETSNKSKNNNSSCTVTSSTSQKHCIFCDGSSHSVESCYALGKKVPTDRVNFFKSKGLCFGCTRPGHLSRDCKNRCVCATCKGRHPTCLHDDSKMQRQQYADHKNDNVVNVEKTMSAFTSVENSMSCHTGAGEVDCAMAVIPVNVTLQNGLQSVSTYAFLDPGSNVSFITDELLHKIGGNGKRMSISIDTMGVPHKMETRAVSGLQISDLNYENQIELNRVYTKDKIPISKDHIPTQEDISGWNHLQDVTLPSVDTGIGILIGNNVPDAYTPLQIRTGPRGSPHATQSRLGWIVWNLVRDKIGSHGYSVNRAEVRAISEEVNYRQLDQLVRDSYNVDFPERLIDDQRECSQEDKRFIHLVENSIEFIGGHYLIGLPFKKENVTMPNNEVIALRRLVGLKRKLSLNSSFRNDYIEFMQQVIDKGFAEKVQQQDIKGSSGGVWYIPHHGVYHPKKPNKLRVVFDCAATCQGISLNSVLLQGPDMTNNLLGVLLRFREEQIAIMSDIETMFYQVKVPEQDRDYLRFFWWPEGDTSKEPQIYRMAVHLFGATSSPSCSSFALRQTAADNGNQFDDQIADGVRRNFYVDDYLTSVSTKEEAIKVVKDTSSICKLGGFRLTKWISNDHDVLESVPVDDRSKEVKPLDLKHDTLPSDRALGVFWMVETDSLGFKIGERCVPCTRRGILSLTSSVYDPIGFLSPFIFNAKRILQDLCRLGLDWDSEVPDDTQRKWTKWVEDLCRLDQLKIHRCYKPEDFGKVISCELHHFADASDVGYGMVVFLRLIDETGRIHCSFVFGKARVSPLKKITIPRLELTAAATLVRVNKMLIQELDYTITRNCFWTDSTSVLKYVKNDSSRFQTFVANRVALIRDATDESQWRYVNTKLNPSDCASRGLSMDKLLCCRQWFNGPDFLWKLEDEWPEQMDIPDLSCVEDTEIKKVVNMAQSSQDHPLDSLTSRVSNWYRLRKLVGWLLVARRNLQELAASRRQLEETLASQDISQERRKIYLQVTIANEQNARLQTSKDWKKICLSANDLRDAETEIVRYEQQKQFKVEINLLQDGQHVKRSSVLFKLDPLLKDSIVRVGGRIQRASLPFEAKHPVVLPKNFTVSKLVLEDSHQKVGHLGKNAILAHVRRTYWIIGACSLIKSILAKCTTCKRYQSSPQHQKMASLPSERLTADQPPFHRVGMDYFGPFHVKRGRSNVKRYGVIFTCLTTRAVHLEVAATLDADSCINAVRRFISRRGPVSYIRSDNGTNLVATERELREEINKLQTSKIKSALLKNNITWEFNPPAASHFGGIWERLIRIVRKVMYSLLHTQTIRLDDEGLNTLLCEVEGILNGRPITEMSNNPNDLDGLTPNHILRLQGGEDLPPGVFDQNDIYCKRRWRQIQYLSDLFSKRWIKEYVPLLQLRQKWNSPHRNVSIGDIVLLVDSTPRNAWALGRVLEVFSDKKGFVRSVRVKTKSATLLRPVAKLCLVLEAD